MMLATILLLAILTVGAVSAAEDSDNLTASNVEGDSNIAETSLDNDISTENYFSSSVDDDVLNSPME